MRPLQHKCPTLRGDKDDTERRQTITCQKFHPNTGYLFHLMYAYITQGRPDRGLLRLTPRAQAIITQGNRRLCSATTATHANHRQNHPGEPHLRLSPHSNRPPTHTQRHRHHLLH